VAQWGCGGWGWGGVIVFEMGWLDDGESGI
jgi:hypothetical protein